MNCAKCKRDVGGVDQRAAYLCVEALGDEYVHSFWRCEACGSYTQEIYHDVFCGEPTVSVSGPIEPARGASLVALMRACPDPWDKRCTCAAHREFA